MALTDAQVQDMLSQLRTHFREPVRPLSAYCAAFHTWHKAVRDASEANPTDSSQVSMLQRIDGVRVDVMKSNLLFRLLYLGEPLRTEPCPIHKGHWSGCVSPERECPHCMSGSDVTGWVKPPESKADVTEPPTPIKNPVFVYLGSTLLDSPNMVASEKRPFVFTLTSIDMQEGFPKPRCWGWFETLEQAEEYLVKDYGDIHEGGTNTYAVIEKCESGVCPSHYTDADRWYRFIPVEGQDFKYTVERIAKPEAFDGVVGFGLG